MAFKAGPIGEVSVLRCCARPHDSPGGPTHRAGGKRGNRTPATQRVEPVSNRRQYRYAYLSVLPRYLRGQGPSLLGYGFTRMLKVCISLLTGGPPNKCGGSIPRDQCQLWHWRKAEVSIPTGSPLPSVFKTGPGAVPGNLPYRKSRQCCPAGLFEIFCQCPPIVTTQSRKCRREDIVI